MPASENVPFVALATERETGPASETRAPLAPGPEIVPEIVKVARKSTPVTSAPFTVTVRLGGWKAIPLPSAVTVYVPFDTEVNAYEPSAAILTVRLV